ncbi:NADP-dependent oxidoreductase [Streptomyces ficellus]|uniref:NADP-dependent oxidoreductase n=2 Tax=Streptomyces ficellus TaxID=1977088 RepID=A0A6I6FLX7_9ACTN|nr:NADP-dependent oxidoreductase [Streptomyces ficellus]QGV82577.1 NADP-dependent oxidoreductase [Streptomyces ficellus]
MRAAAFDAFGGPDTLRVRDLPVPVPGEGEVLVRVHAAGVNAIDRATRAGRGVGVERFPAVPGWDVSGTVAATGPGARRFTEGDAVFGMPRFPALAGGYAEYAVAPETELARKPDAVGHVVAASLPMVGLTAWQTLFEHGGLRPGQRVLVSGAAGGVGHIAVQLAVDAGAEVIGTASPAHHDFVRSLGAHQAVDYRTVPLQKEVADVDLAVDPMGGPEFYRLLDVLRPGGIVVTLKGEEADHRQTARAHGVRAGFTYVHPDGPVLERLAALLEAGSVRPEIQRVLPLEEAAAAHALGEDGHARGRIVLHLDGAAS